MPDDPEADLSVPYGDQLDKVLEAVTRARNTGLIEDLKARHTQEAWPSGTGQHCAECTDRIWPCPTRQTLDRITEGT